MFLFFFCCGVGGRGRRCPRRWPGGRFFIKNIGRGGGFRGGCAGGGKGARGNVCGGRGA